MQEDRILAEGCETGSKTKGAYVTPRVLYSYNREEMEAAMQQEGVSGGAGCGCGSDAFGGGG